MQRILAIALLMVLTSTAANAAPFWGAYISKKEWLVVDIATIKDLGRNKLAWSYMVMNSKAGASASAKLAYSAQFMEYDCDYQRTKLVTLQTFNRDATLVESWDQPEKWETTPPGSVPASMLAAVCDPASRSPSRMMGKAGAGMVDFFELGAAMLDPSGYQAEKSSAGRN